MAIKKYNFDKDENNFVEKIDVLDLLVNILKEHEQKFEELVEQLERVTYVLSKNKLNMGTDILDDLEDEEHGVAERCAICGEMSVYCICDKWEDLLEGRRPKNDEYR